ncbi:hypothetical protein LSAT2_012956 [Lamellibrachia satsuma]|nr:hypothetical protein LSAT2_012956 [Lamellibrachia satsuma]
MAGKWPPPPDYDVEKLSVTETTYGAMNHSVAMLLERRRAQNKAWREPTITRIPPPPPPQICVPDPPTSPLPDCLSPAPIHTSIDDASRYDRYLHEMDRYDKFQEMYPKVMTQPASKTNNVRIGRWGSNWSNMTEATNATGGFDVYINGNARYRAQEEEKKRKMIDCFARRRMPAYATNRTSRRAIERTGRDPVDTYCNMLVEPDTRCSMDYRCVDFGYDVRPPPDYKYKGFYQHRPFRNSVGIPAYNKAMEGAPEGVVCGSSALVHRETTALYRAAAPPSPGQDDDNGGDNWNEDDDDAL